MADIVLAFVKGITPGISQQSIVPDQGGLLYVGIDPNWAYYKQWRDRALIGGYLSMTFCDLDSGVEENAPVNYQETNVLGRAEQFQTYIGNGNRELNFTFQFRAQGVKTSSYYDAIDQEVTKPVKWLDSLKFPFVDDQNISHAPPPLIVAIGQIIRMRAIAVAVTPRWLPPYDPATMLAQSADVACTFRSVHTSLGNYDYNGPGRFIGGIEV